EKDRRGGAIDAEECAAAPRPGRERRARGGRRALGREAHLAIERRFQGWRGRHAADRQLRGAGEGTRALKPWLVAALVALAAGCATPALNRGSPAQSRLTDAEGRAAALAKSGDYAGAARYYGEALRIATALQNGDAIAANAINLSIVDQWLGRDAEARAALAPVLDQPRANFSDRRKVQAELRRAILELAGGNTGAAAVFALEAERRCAKTSCEYAATILNVRAQTELDSGHAADAAGDAEAARGYQERSVAVSRAMSEAKSGAEMELLLRR